MSRPVTRPPGAASAAAPHAPHAPHAPGGPPAAVGRGRPRGWPFTFSVERVDRHRVLTWFALAGLVAGALMAGYGLPPIDLHGPLHHFGIMGPTCGATRSVRYAMMGEWGTSLRYNPLGIPLVAGAAFLMLRTAVGAATRRWLNVQVWWTRPLVIVVVLAAIALEVNQQLHVDLIGP